MSAAHIGASGSAFDRESHAIRTAWDAMSAQAGGDALDRLYVEVVLPYVGALHYAGTEIEQLVAMARRVEDLLAA